MNLKNTLQLRSISLFIINYTEILLQNQTSQYANLKYSFLLAIKPTAHYSTKFKLKIFTRFPTFALAKALLKALCTIPSLYSMSTVFSFIILLDLFLQQSSQRIRSA